MFAELPAPSTYVPQIDGLPALISLGCGRVRARLLVTPGHTVELPLSVPAPPKPGNYALHLLFPDPAPRLSTQPAYSIQLANTGTWNATTGWNDLHHSVAVSPAPTPTYDASTAIIANPDRGMYHYTETHYRPDGSGYVPLDATQLTRWRTQDDITLVYRIFYLEKFVTQDTLDASYLQAVRTDFSLARAAGIKLVVRFAYTENSPVDAAPALMRGLSTPGQN